MNDIAWSRSPLLQAFFVFGICVAVALLAWFGFRASREWQRSSTMLVDRRADEAASLFATALARDMRAVQTDILVSRAWDDLQERRAHDVTTLVASAFARYPYPDTFFAIQEASGSREAVFFLRTDRAPSWSASSASASRYPVRVERAPEVAESIDTRIRGDVAAGRSWSVFETELEGRAYQIITRLDYSDRLNQHLRATYGFTVDLEWVRQHYYPEITHQIQRISGGNAGLELAVIDDADKTVAATSAAPLTTHLSRRSFPVLFIDPRIVALNPPTALPTRTWTVVASGATDPTLVTAIGGARWTLVLASLAAIALAVGLLLSARAIRAWAAVAEMRAEFMSSVTHELKTPIAAIQALAQTLVGGRVAFPDAQREYGSLIATETRQLARLVENLLAHSRITDIADVYSFEPLDVEVLFREAAATLAQPLRQADVSLQLNTDPDIPPIHADPAAMALLLDNLLDNAIRYSAPSRCITLSASRVALAVRIIVADEGVGIAREDVHRVVHKFYRGRNARPGGSGLGLAIVRRIVSDHRGALRIDSELGKGTTVIIDLPAALEEDASHADPDGRLA